MYLVFDDMVLDGNIARDSSILDRAVHLGILPGDQETVRSIIQYQLGVGIVQA